MTLTRQKTIKKLWLRFLNRVIAGDNDRADVDMFIAANDMNNEEIDYLNSIPVEVVVKGENNE
jgi:hypothetical protein